MLLNGCLVTSQGLCLLQPFHGLPPSPSSPRAQRAKGKNFPQINRAHREQEWVPQAWLGFSSILIWLSPPTPPLQVNLTSYRGYANPYLARKTYLLQKSLRRFFLLNEPL
jgi:hypothetical protein